MKVIVFGIGLYYQNRRKKFPKEVEIVAFIDNNNSFWGKAINGIKIDTPLNVMNYNFEKIVLMSKHDDEMLEQLISLNIERKKIITWEQLYKKFTHGRFHFFCGNEMHGEKGRILIISTPLGYNGAPIAARYAGKALQMKGYDIILCAESGNPKFINETVAEGMNVVLCPIIPYLGKEELFWIKQFDLVLVNTFLLIQCACEISCWRPTIWWIHECSAKYANYYPDTIEKYADYIDKINTAKIDVLGVSSIARYNFNKYFPKRIQKTLSYGIEDKNYSCDQYSGAADIFVFAVVGTFCELKGQKEFIEAINLIETSKIDNVEFWLIGGGDGEYKDYITSIARSNEHVKIMGELTCNEMDIAYKSIDVVVCPSLEETMSLVLTEGMMWGKVCITTDKTGMAEYIVNGQNGLICEAGNVDSLYCCLKWVLENRKRLPQMKVNARETYTRYFSLEQFADRLEEIMIHVQSDYN